MQNPTEGKLSRTAFTPDEFDRVYQKTDKLLGVSWTYSYYETGQLDQSASPESGTGAGDAQNTTCAYDIMGRLLVVTLPDN